MAQSISNHARSRSFTPPAKSGHTEDGGSQSSPCPLSPIIYRADTHHLVLKGHRSRRRSEIENREARNKRYRSCPISLSPAVKKEPLDVSNEPHLVLKRHGSRRRSETENREARNKRRRSYPIPLSPTVKKEPSGFSNEPHLVLKRHRRRRRSEIENREARNKRYRSCQIYLSPAVKKEPSDVSKEPHLVLKRHGRRRRSEIENREARNKRYRSCQIYLSPAVKKEPSNVSKEPHLMRKRHGTRRRSDPESRQNSGKRRRSCSIPRSRKPSEDYKEFLLMRKKRLERIALLSSMKSVGPVRLLTQSLLAINKEHKSVSGETLPRSEALNSHARHQYSKLQEISSSSGFSTPESSGVVRNTESASDSPRTPQYRSKTQAGKLSSLYPGEKYFDIDKPSVRKVPLLTQSLLNIKKKHKFVSGEILPKSEALNSHTRHQYSKLQEDSNSSSFSTSESSGVVRNTESASDSPRTPQYRSTTHSRSPTSSEEKRYARKLSSLYPGEKYFDIDKPSVGKIYNGVVTTVKQRGCFVELEGLESPWEGLVHLCEMENGDNLVHAEDIVEEGQIVKVKVLSLNRDRIRLSMKEVDQDTGKDLQPKKRPLASQEEKK